MRPMVRMRIFPLQSCNVPTASTLGGIAVVAIVGDWDPALGITGCMRSSLSFISTAQLLLAKLTSTAVSEVGEWSDEVVTINRPHLICDFKQRYCYDVSP